MSLHKYLQCSEEIQIKRIEFFQNWINGFFFISHFLTEGRKYFAESRIVRGKPSRSFVQRIKDSFEHLIRTSSAMKARLVFGRISTTDRGENYLYLPRYWHEIRRYVLKENNQKIIHFICVLGRLKDIKQ